MIANTVGAFLGMAFLATSGLSQETRQAVTGSPAAPSPWGRTAIRLESPNLNSPLDLRPTIAVRDRVVRLVRSNETVVASGRIESRVLARAAFRRRTAPGPDGGRDAGRIEWLSYDFGIGMGDAPINSQSYPQAAQIAFDYDPEETDLMRDPIDVTAGAPDIAGVILQAMVLDAVTWDALLQQFVDEVGTQVEIGTSVTVPAWTKERPLPGPAGSPVGAYLLGPTRIELAGMTRVAGEPAALIWFEVAGAELSQTLDLSAVSVAMDGGEWFRGMMAVSLVDGRIVRGELWGVVIQEVSTKVGDQQAIKGANTVLQRVNMWEVAEAASE